MWHRILSSSSLGDFIQWILLSLLLLLCPLSGHFWSMCISYYDSLRVRLVTPSSGSPTTNHFPTNLPSDLHRKRVYTALELRHSSVPSDVNHYKPLIFPPRISRQSVTNTDFWKLQRNVAERSVGRKWVAASIEIKIKPSPNLYLWAQNCTQLRSSASQMFFSEGVIPALATSPPLKRIGNWNQALSAE